MTGMCFVCHLTSFRLLKESWPPKFQERQMTAGVPEDQVQVTGNHTVVVMIDIMGTVVTIITNLVRSHTANRLVNIVIMVVNVQLLTVQSDMMPLVSYCVHMLYFLVAVEQLVS